MLCHSTDDQSRDEERSLQYTYDNLGRVSQVMMQNGGTVYEIDEDEKTDTDTADYTGDVNIVSYQFADGGQGANSAGTRVTRIVHSALNAQLDYAYDELGNIVSETCDLDGNTNQYRYDKLGQLIRASVRNDTTCGIGGTTWVYTYDLGGNILKKEGYPKLTDIDNELPETASKVVKYTYDAEWKDLLVSYDGKAIQYTPDTLPQMPDGMTYFHMGNLHRLDGWTYGWEAGRQLESMTHLDELGAQDKKLEFSYDAAGLRMQKKYTYTDAEGHAVIETTDYILHGKLLMHQKTTTTVDGMEQEPYQLHFYYDKSSRSTMVRVSNEEAESHYYSYVHSLQGDILGIIDSEQDLVVEYAYDPWGKPLETRCLKTGCEMLAEMNPFRYRGYVYDEETGLYYLRSRYYNLVWGRFMNGDSVLGYHGRLLAHNIFAYCCNNPLILSDDSGLIQSYCVAETDAGDDHGPEPYSANWFRYHDPMQGLTDTSSNMMNDLLKEIVEEIGQEIRETFQAGVQGDIITAQLHVTAANNIIAWTVDNQKEIKFLVDFGMYSLSIISILYQSRRL